MTPQNQLTKRGCIAACIATMLELPVEQIPDFTADDFENLEVVNGVEYPKWWLRLQGWLSERNLCFIEIALPAGVAFNALPFPALVMLAGNTASGTRHVVVGSAGAPPNQFEWLHDPLENGTGLESVESVIVLAPLDVSRFTKLGQALEQIEKIAGSPVSQPHSKSEIVRICKEALGKPLIQLA